MLADILVCSGVGAMVIAVIIYKCREAKKAKKNGGCSCCSECKGECRPSKKNRF